MSFINHVEFVSVNVCHPSHLILLMEWGFVTSTDEANRPKHVTVVYKKCNKFDLRSYREIDVITSKARVVLLITQAIAIKKRHHDRRSNLARDYKAGNVCDRSTKYYIILT